MKYHKKDAIKPDRNTAIYVAMRELGRNNFCIEEIETVDDVVLDERERYWIKTLDTIVPNGYNETIGGLALYGSNNPFYGKAHSEATKNKISEIQKQVEHRSGWNHTDESKKKMRDSQMGYVWSEESKRKLSKTMSGKKVSEDTKEKIRKTQETKDITAKSENECIYFKCMSDAVDYILNNNLSKTTNRKTVARQINHSINGTKNIIYGYKWAI